MAIQYYMRAFKTSSPAGYVDWVVNDTPDTTGAFSGFPSNELVNITVNRVVQSKVANFLKQNQSLGGTDGYFFHVNSYDWRNATAPILPPTHLVGFAVERGIASVAAINGATNSSPILITTSAPHGLVDGQLVTVSGVTGNIAANGTWPIVNATGTNLTLVGSVGTGTYTGGGTVYVPNDMPTLAWDDPNQLWRFFSNTEGDGTTIGPSQDIQVNNLFMDGFLAIGPDPADTGAIRLSNNTFIFSESNPSGTDVQLIGADLLNRIKLGVNATDIVYAPGVFIVDGYIQHDGTGSNTAQTTGFIREQNSTNIVAFRGTASLAGSDIVALASSNNNVVIGDPINLGVIYNTSGTPVGNVHQFQVNSSGRVEIGDTASSSFIRFVASGLAGAPTILQTTATAVNASGQTLTIQAQNGGPGTSVGGILQLTSGIGTPGTGTGVHGTLDLLTGGQLQMRIFPDVADPTTNNNSILYFQNLFRVDSAQTAPVFRQDTTLAASGQPYTIQAQNAATLGGNLVLTSGTGTTNGNVLVQAGFGTSGTQIIVSPNVIPPGTTPMASPLGSVVITGNLEVVGTTTTIDSTIVDIIGRVIHANWADPISSPVVGVPTLITGYSIHRGNIGSGSPRDGASWIWTEGTNNDGADGYWRAVTINGDGYSADNYTIANSPFTLGVLAKDFVVSSDPNPVPATIPVSGGLRITNNTAGVVARNTGVLTKIAAGSNLAALPQANITVDSTTGFTTAGTILVISSAGPQTITYTGTNATQFTGASGGTGTLAIGSTVAQTNASTTIAAGSNNIILPIGTINVASAVGFPVAGTLRIRTRGASGGIQTVTYTGTTGTSFTGCTGGTGVMSTGDPVTLLPIPGSTDIQLIGTDFGNRITIGDGYSPTNVGQIFSTSAGGNFDFWVNSISRIQLANGDVDADGFADVITISPPVINPKIWQLPQPNTGTNNGFNMMLQAQAGQQQQGVTTNNNGGALILSSGPRGTGGSGAVGIDGYVDVWTGTTLKIRTFPTEASPLGNNIDDNSILYFESLFRVDAAQTGAGSHGVGTGIRFKQDDTGSGVGATYTIQAQNAATTGGNLVLTSGAGSSAPFAGQVRLSTGLTAALTPTSIDRVIVYPAGSPVLPQGPSNISYTEFRDNTTPFQAVFITPVSDGISSLGFATTVLGAQIAQVATATTNGAPMTIQAQVSSFNGGTGGNLVLIAGNETGTTSIGGNINLTTGTGTALFGNGVVNVMIGGTQAIQFNNVDNDASGFSEVMTIASTIGTPRIYQASTGSASGTILALMAQNAATTGGPLQLHSGTGATNDGYINLTTGNTVKMTIFPTTAVSVANDNSILLFENKFRFDTAQVTPLIRQDDRTTPAGTGETFTVQAQNETGGTSIGGALVLTSGTGTLLDGYVHIRTGNVDKIIVHPDFTEFRDTAEAYRITPVSAGTTTLQAASTVTALTYKQADLITASGTGATTTIQAQNETGTTSVGGALTLTSGTGTSANGALNLQSGGVNILSLTNPNLITINANTIQFASAVIAPTINQANTGGASGQPLILQSQNAVTTGGPLLLTSGTGATNDGYVNIITGTTTKVTIFPTTAVSAANNNSILLFENRVRFDTAQVTPLIRQDDETGASTSGEILTLQAQNATGATSPGGALVLTSGTGTTVAGNTHLQTGGVDRVIVHPTFTEIRDSAEALRFTPVSTGTTSMQFASTVLAARIFQADLTSNGGIGTTLTVQAQNETGTTSLGGDLSLTSGTGTSSDGYTNLQAGGSNVARVHTNKFIFSKGWRRHITPISSGVTYTVIASDDYIAITTLDAPFQINLPTDPVLGDTYEFKDATGNAGTQTVTISGNAAFNIDGTTSIVLNQAYASVTVTFTGSEWSVT